MNQLPPIAMTDKIEREGVTVTAPSAAFRYGVPLVQTARLLRPSCDGSRGVTEEDTQSSRLAPSKSRP